MILKFQLTFLFIIFWGLFAFCQHVNRNEDYHNKHYVKVDTISSSRNLSSNHQKLPPENIINETMRYIVHDSTKAPVHNPKPTEDIITPLIRVRQKNNE